MPRALYYFLSFFLISCAQNYQFKSRIPLPQILQTSNPQFWQQYSNKSFTSEEDRAALNLLQVQMSLPFVDKALLGTGVHTNQLNTHSSNPWQNEALLVAQALYFEGIKQYPEAARTLDRLLSNSEASATWRGLATYHLVLNCAFDVFARYAEQPFLEKFSENGLPQINLPGDWNEVESLSSRALKIVKVSSDQEGSQLALKCFDWAAEVYKNAKQYALNEAQKKYLYQVLDEFYQIFYKEPLSLRNLALGIEQPSTGEGLEALPTKEWVEGSALNSLPEEPSFLKELSLLEAQIKKEQLTTSLDLMLVRKEKQSALLKETLSNPNDNQNLSSLEAKLDLVPVAYPDLSRDFLENKIKDLQDLEGELKNASGASLANGVSKQLAQKYYRRLAYYQFLKGDLKGYVSATRQNGKIASPIKGYASTEEAGSIIAALVLLEQTSSALEIICGSSNVRAKNFGSKCLAEISETPVFLYWLAKLALRLGEAEIAQDAAKILLRSFPLDYYSISWLQQTSDASLYQQWQNSVNHQFYKPSGDTWSFAQNKQVLLAEWLEELLLNDHLELLKIYLPQFAADNQKSFNKQSGLRLWLVQLLYAGDSFGRGMYETSLLPRVLNLNIWDFVKGSESDFLKLFFPLPYNEWVQQAAPDFDPLFVQAIMRQESAFNLKAVSSANAYGLLQLIPATGKRMAALEKIKWEGSKTLLDPQKNIRLGVAYMRLLSKIFQNNGILVSAAYNAGEKALMDWLNALQPYLAEGLEADALVELIPFEETKRYVKNVARNTFFHHLLYVDSPTLNAEQGQKPQPFSFAYLRQKIFFQKAQLKELYSFL